MDDITYYMDLFACDSGLRLDNLIDMLCNSGIANKIMGRTEESATSAEA
jgi:hypothetical protein